MPAVNFRHDRRQIIVPTAIYRPNNPQYFEVARALVDTGASISGVSRAVADRLDLPRRGKQLITTPSGQHVARLYAAGIGLFPSQSGEFDRVSLPHMLPDVFMMIECSPGTQFDILLGMDVLGQCDLYIRPDGTGALIF